MTHPIPHRCSPWRSLPLLAVLCGTLLAGCGAELPPLSMLTFEEFKASLPREADGAYLVEGDLLVHGEQALRDYYEAAIAAESMSTADGPELAQQESSLAAAQRMVCRGEEVCPPPPPCIELPVCDPLIGPSSCQTRRYCAPTSLTIWTCELALFPPRCEWRTINLQQAACYTQTICAPEDDFWSSSEVLNLTYCLKDFGSRQAEVARAVRDAASAWEKVANVRFLHRRDLDGGGCSSSAGAVFTVEPRTGVSYLAASFLPWDSVRALTVNLPGIDGQSPSGANTRSLQQLLTHELGHVLGFGHEETQSNDYTCSPNWVARNLTTYDSLSIMRYPSCPVSQPDALRELSARDGQGARSIYGAPSRIRPVGVRTSDGCFLKAEGEGGGRISSRGNGIFPGEAFELIELGMVAGGTQVALRARNGDFVAAEVDGTLSANRSQLGPWERFLLAPGASSGQVTLRTAHGKWVSASCSTSLVGTNDGGQASNQFMVIGLEDNPIALKANNGKYLQSQLTPTAIGHRILRDEKLFLVQLGNGKVALRSRDGRFARAINGGGGSVAFDSPGLGNHETYTLQTMPGEMQVAFRAMSGHWLTIDGWGQLVASASSAQPFTHINLAGEKVALQTSNGKLVHAYNGGGHEVRAISSSISDAETFFLVRLGGGKVALRTSRGMYLTADANNSATGNGLLNARADWLDTWERYTLTTNGSRFCFQAESTNQFVSAEGGGGRELIANRDQCAEWEGFALVGF
jgi:hypothetical protein